LTLRESDGVSTIENLLSGEDFVMMNTAKPPFDDIRVRQALTFAADREGYLEFIAQGTKPEADSMYHPSLPENNPDVVQEGNMPELAGPLIDAYCADVPDQCTDGRVNMELQFSGPSTLQDRIMALLGDGWAPYFNITLDQLPQDEHVIEVATGAYQVVVWRQLGEADPDNEIVWNECASSTGLLALNWVRYCDEARDELFFEARATTDEARRIEIMQEVQVNMNEAYTHIFLTHANWTLGFRDNVKNLCGQKGPQGETLLCNTQGRGFYHNVWLSEG
jgi:ABC-type transport system substrate-binding protein